MFYFHQNEYSLLYSTVYIYTTKTESVDSASTVTAAYRPCGPFSNSSQSLSSIPVLEGRKGFTSNLFKTYFQLKYNFIASSFPLSPPSPPGSPPSNPFQTPSSLPLKLMASFSLLIIVICLHR